MLREGFVLNTAVHPLIRSVERLEYWIVSRFVLVNPQCPHSIAGERFPFRNLIAVQDIRSASRDKNTPDVEASKPDAERRGMP